MRMRKRKGKIEKRRKKERERERGLNNLHLYGYSLLLRGSAILYAEPIVIIQLMPYWIKNDFALSVIVV